MTRVLSEGRERPGWRWDILAAWALIVAGVILVWALVAIASLAMWGLL